MRRCKEPINDARALADELRRAGFDVDTGENLSKDAMRRAFDRLYGRVKPGAVVLVFFSGYGIQSNQQSYMIPVDAHIWTEAEVRRDGISLDTVLAEISAREATTKIAILDAFRRNPFERRYRLTSAGLAPPSAARGNLVMYSTAPGNLTDDAARGAFVSELIKQIRAPRLTVEEAFDRTRMEVSRATQGGQVPWFMSLISEDFSFDSKSAVVAANQPSAVPQAKLARPEENNPAVAPPSKIATASPPQIALPAPSKPNVPQDGKPFVQPDAKPVVTETAKAPTQPPTLTPVTPDATKPTSTPEIKLLSATKRAGVQLASRPDRGSDRQARSRKPDPPKPQAPISNAAKSPQAPAPPAVVAPVENAAIASLNARLQHDPSDATAYYKRGQLYARRTATFRARPPILTLRSGSTRRTPKLSTTAAGHGRCLRICRWPCRIATRRYGSAQDMSMRSTAAAWST